MTSRSVSEIRRDVNIIIVVRNVELIPPYSHISFPLSSRVYNNNNGAAHDRAAIDDDIALRQSSTIRVDLLIYRFALSQSFLSHVRKVARKVSRSAPFRVIDSGTDPRGADRSVSIPARWMTADRAETMRPRAIAAGGTRDAAGREGGGALRGTCTIRA